MHHCGRRGLKGAALGAGWQAGPMVSQTPSFVAAFVQIHRIKVDLPFRKDFMDSSFDRDVSEEIEAAEKER